MFKMMMAGLYRKNPRWISLVPFEKKQTNTLLNFIVEDDQKMKGKFSESYFGYSGAEKLEEVNKFGEVKFIEELKNEFQHLKMPNFRIKRLKTMKQ